MSDDDLIEHAAREYVERHGADSVRVLTDHAEMADEVGDTPSAQTWRDIADAAERIVRSDHISMRMLYSSPNGDRWLLCRDRDGVFVRHEPNAPSGGKVSKIEIGDFLSRGPRNPEHQALLRLIGTLAHGG